MSLDNIAIDGIAYKGDEEGRKVTVVGDPLHISRLNDFLCSGEPFPIYTPKNGSRAVICKQAPDTHCVAGQNAKLTFEYEGSLNNI